MLKKIVVKADKGFKVYGKCVRPNEVNTFNVRQIFGLLSIAKIKVFEVLPDGELLQLNKNNYDKVNHSSVPSVIKTEDDHKPLEPINDGNPLQSDVSSNDDEVESTGPVENIESEIVEEPENNEKEKEPIIECSASEIDNKEESDESTVDETKSTNILLSTSELSTEEPETNDNEESIIESTEEQVNDTVSEMQNHIKSQNNHSYNIPKKSNKYKK